MAAMPALASPPSTANSSSHGPDETTHHRELSLSGVIMSSEPLAPLRCCCGRSECLFLQHNCTVLESVENDVRIAARLGQSLLERHEVYMADAERDRTQLVGRIEQLEMDKRELEAENVRNIEENRALLNQLEALNTTVADSDTRIKMLEASLQSSQLAIRRLDGASERAEEMERHLSALEAEQATLQNTLVASESEARSAIQRWKRAERGIADLQYQLEKMEQESKLEKERHLEIVARMERQRAVERELSTAAGRLKGAAAAKSLQDRAGGSGVVTHFVRDLLQDNANMQLGMAELREMLMNSNDEIQQLRDQLMFHQPIPEANPSAAATLRAELGMKLLPDTPEVPEPSETSEPSEPSELLEADMVVPYTPTTPVTPSPHRRLPSSTLQQELHIHHHFHLSKKKVEPPRPKKRRSGLAPTIFSPPSGLSRSVGYYNDVAGTAPGSPSGHSSRCSSRHLSRESVSTTLSAPSNRWSLFSDPPSEMTVPSLSSSPQTNPRTSVFYDASLPTSPATSFDLASPHWRNTSSPMRMDDSFACGSSPPCRLSASLGANERDDRDAAAPCVHGPILEEVEAESSDETDETLPDAAQAEVGRYESTTPKPGEPFPALDTSTAVTQEESTSPKSPWNGRHRALSHESVISLNGGLDIHTLKVRPSQLTLRPLGTYGTALADTGVSSITAKPVMSRSRHLSRSSTMLREQQTSTARGFGRFVAWRPWSGSNNNNNNNNARSSPALDSLVIVASAAATDPLPPAASDVGSESDSRSVLSDTNRGSQASQAGQASQPADSDNTKKAPAKALQEMLRAPGINQPGVIPGFFQRRVVVPHKIHADDVDHEALREGLEGGALP